ncbi:hypothetical protein BGW36DRAFT_301684 [Talaromyces proteolyticus]|uniref:Transcription factor domain-containing protein n=1 Tax=Talaromyces proteolyticus TaxID=1131652 RepID=A0AAD4KJN1_9EURO|nr:uncharacterized protein BGW36DRAFT_301684 [Talaromyces proteolyticus]KAH8692801.1 hypothetical protein BGW36DRAFT_301684 [Talaromyces proteolyticus]
MQSPPCARCLRLNIPCTVEPCYRRVNRRDRVQQLEAQVQELKDILNREKPETAANSTHSVDTASFHHSDVRSTDLNAMDESIIVSRAEPPAEQEIPSEEHQKPESTDYTLGSVRLSVMQVEQLVHIFFEKYHPMLPFLEESRTPAEYYRASRLLFWSIIAVSARNFSTDPSLLMKLTPALSELLWKTITSNPISLAQVQALILNSCWPLPNFRFWSDKSPVYANLALIYATHLGLHMPGHEQEYSQKKVPSTNIHIVERSNAWIACRIVAQSVTINLGLPPLAPLGYNFSQAHEEDMTLNIPLHLKHNFLIQNSSFRATQVLFSLRESSSTYTPTDTYAELESIENDFYLLHQSLEKELSFINSVRLSGAILLFQCLYFVQDKSQRRKQRKEGILRAYETATKLITTAISHDSAHEELLYSPVIVGRLIFVAALVIFRVLHSIYATATTISGQQPDRNAGQILYNSACFAIRRCSVQSNGRDFSMRMADLLKALWRGGENDAELCSQEPTVKVQSRLGAGIVFDCLQIWRGYGNPSKDPSRECSRGNSNTRNGPQQQQNSLGQTSSYQPQSFATLQQGSVGSEWVNDSSLPIDLFDGVMSGGWEEMLNPDWNFLDEFHQNTQDWEL